MIELLRAVKVEIETPVIDGDNWVRATIQTVELDDNLNVVALRIADKNVFRRVNDVALEQHSFISPLTGELKTLPVADVAAAVKSIIINWMVNDFNAELVNGLVVAK